MDNTLGLLGLARKARKLEIGAEQCGVCARGGYARVIFTAHNAADNSLRRADHLGEICGCPHIRLKYTKEEIGKSIGKDNTAIFAICDAALGAAFAKKACAGMPEYTEQVEELERRAARIAKRKGKS